jgi:flagellar biosynthesis/type III secretory pathway M-ring protein FliF/YscJ
MQKTRLELRLQVLAGHATWILTVAILLAIVAPEGESRLHMQVALCSGIVILIAVAVLFAYVLVSVVMLPRNFRRAEAALAARNQEAIREFSQESAGTGIGCDTGLDSV